MFFRKNHTIKYSAIFLLFLFALTVPAQTSTASLNKQNSETDKSSKTEKIEKIVKTVKTESESDSTSAESELGDSSQKYRLLQSNDFLVETPYLQEEGELEHSFSFSRTNRRRWSMVFTEELPLGSEKHQLSISVPSQLVGNGAEKYKGLGDVEIEYNYGLFGGNTSRVTVSPGFGLSLPTGSARKELGAGGIGFSFKVPVGVMLTKRFASNSSFEVSYTKSARNDEGARANLFGYEIGQSFVWFARPKLNFLLEAVWEREQEVVGPGLKESEREFLISPGVRWAYAFKNGLIISPGVAVPVGVGPSRGEKGIFFYLSFEHSFRKER